MFLRTVYGILFFTLFTLCGYAQEFYGGNIEYGPKQGIIHYVRVHSYWSTGGNSMSISHSAQGITVTGTTRSQAQMSNGIYHVVQEQEVRYPGNSSSDEITATGCCRPAVINSSGNTAELRAYNNYIKSDPTYSPVFNAGVRRKAVPGIPLTLNLGGSDPDGSITRYTLMDPYSVTGYSYPPGLNIDSQTGEITWADPQAGLWLISVRAYEAEERVAEMRYSQKDYLIHVGEDIPVCPDTMDLSLAATQQGCGTYEFEVVNNNTKGGGGMGTNSAYTESWIWDFGDGATSTEWPGTHTYAGDGTYTVTFTLYSTNHLTGEICRVGFTSTEITVSCGTPYCSAPDNYYLASHPLSCSTYEFELLTTEIIGNDSPAQSEVVYHWELDFGDGVTVTDESDTHTYTANGTYTVSFILYATNAAGDVCIADTSSTIVTVSCSTLYCSETDNFHLVSSQFSCGSYEFEAVTSDVISNDNTSASAYTWEWDFGDGTTSTEWPGAHTYAANGTYTVSFILYTTNASGEECIADTSSMEVTVSCGTLPCGSGDIDFSIIADTTTNCSTWQFNSPYLAQLGRIESMYTLSYEWTFGDGDSDTGKPVTHSYAGYGTYNVLLTVYATHKTTGEVCLLDTTSKVITLSCPVAPCGEQVEFPINSSTQSCNTYRFSTPQLALSEKEFYQTSISYEWTFGDGTSGTGGGVTHTYADGTYTVRLSVYITDKQTGETCLLDTTSTVINVSCSVLPCGEQVEFPINSSTQSCNTYGFSAPLLAQVFNPRAAGGYTVSYEWAFGDGNSGSGSTATHTYADGTYTVSLSVYITNTQSGETCLLDTTSTVVSVNCVLGPCSIAIEFPVTSSTLSCNTYEFTTQAPVVHSEEYGLYTYTYEWAFGDGDTLIDYSATHSYTGNGSYTMTLSVYVTDNKTGETCLMDTTSVVVTVGCPVFPDFTASFTYTGECGSNTIQFINSSTGSPNSYHWSFGDGASSSAINPVHTYPGPGLYLAHLTVTNNGNTTTTSLNIQVSAPVAAFSVGDICLGQVAVMQNVTGGGDTYKWDFGDGNTSSLQNAVHYYTSPGTYTITLVVSKENCPDTTTREISVGAPVSVSYIAPLRACAGAAVPFTGTVSSSPVSYHWNFGDGQHSTQLSPSHVYTAPGYYQVLFKADNGICADSTWKNITIDPVPQVVLQSSAPGICPGKSVTLQAIVQNPTAGSTYSYNWEKDGSPVTFNGAIYTTGNTGTFSVIVNNGCGSSQPVSVQVTGYSAPVAALINTQGTSCPGLADGSAEVQVTPEAGHTYSIQWSSGSTLSTASNLLQGFNFVTVTGNQSGCSITLEANIPYSGPVVTDSMRNAGCASSTGSLKAYVTGGTPGYTYQWQDAAATTLSTSDEATGLAPGIYHLTVTDDAGCSIPVPNLTVSTPVVSGSVSNTGSCGSSGVLVEATAQTFLSTGSAVPSGYSYEWTAASDPGTVLGSGSSLTLIAGSYRLILTDNTYGCKDTVPFSVSPGESISLTAEGTAPTCGGGTNGSLIAHAFGGSGSYNYSWLNSSSQQVSQSAAPENLPAGTYTITVSDGRGCTATQSVILDDPAAISVSWIATSSCQASALATPAGDYDYSWIMVKDNNGDSVAPTTQQVTQGGSVTGLAPGHYVVQVTNATGCTAQAEDTMEVEGRITPRTFEVRFAWVKPDFTDSIPEEEDDNIEEIVNEMEDDLASSLSLCIAKQQEELTIGFDAVCFNKDNFKDELTISYGLPYHHYTLYYYDRGGSLTKTVPPEGVDLLSSDQVGKIKQYRADSSVIPSVFLPGHRLTTQYAYNSLSQLTRQNTPDGGATRFLYNDQAQLRFSQNARQLADTAYSYTRYDHLGRILEVGEAHTNNFASLAPYTDTSYSDYPGTGTSQVTYTEYSSPVSGADYYGQPQRYLLNRVSHSYTDEDGDIATASDQVHTMYSYDPHGNVEWLLQDLPGFSRNYLSYNYDLISGKVLEVKANEHRADKLYHRYGYDEDNRITRAETSRDGHVWDTDATYDYYAHGPLRRSEIGEDKVQGLDYIYTIEGWLKAINQPALDPQQDPGRDGFATDVVRDAFAMSLGYYNGDFARTGFNLGGLHSYATGSLYNGNISTWSHNIFDSALVLSVGTQPLFGKMRGEAFTYDKLNRLKESRMHSHTGSWAAAANNEYRTRYEYDGNGNILKLARQSHGTDNKIDSLDYDYDITINNRLKQVNDLSTAAGNGKQTDLFGLRKFDYDPIGNLTRETSFEYIGGELYSDSTLIRWNPYGKVKEVRKKQHKTADNSLYLDRTIRFMYDASGSRISKEVINDATNPELQTKTWYVKDAQGNTMGVYERNNVIAGSGYEAVYALKEQPIYGSDRIGSVMTSVELARVPFTGTTPPGSSFSVNDLASASTLENWYSPAVKPVALANSDTACDCELKGISFPQGSYQSTATIGSTFLGKAGNAIAVAEDEHGGAHLYVTTAEKYLGHDDVCLVYDRTGSLVKNSQGIKSSHKAKTAVIKKPGNSSRYLFITTGTDKLPYLHEADISRQGYGTPGQPMGEVMQKNQPLATSGSHGLHYAVWEDMVSGIARVYGTRYTPPQLPQLKGTTEIIAWEITPSGAQPPVTVATLEGYETQGNGELQLSPDGKRLALYHRDKYIAGFAHQQIEVHLLGLDGSGMAVAQRDTLEGNNAGTWGKSSVDFAENRNYLYFNQRGIYQQSTTQSEKVTWQFDSTLAAYTLANTTAYGELRRGRDQKIYLAPYKDDSNLYALTESGTTINITPQAVVNAGSGYQLTGNLPSQPFRVLPSLIDTFSRRIGEKVYELKDHLGNVRVTVSDRREAVVNGLAVYNYPSVQSYNDYYPFGMQMPGRGFNSNSYRYGFNGQEKDKEIGEGIYTAEFWEYDSRLGRRCNVDPAFKEKPWMSSYHAFSNKPILNVDPNGANDDEYDKDGKKISDLGGDKVNFYHQENGDTKVEDQQTCATNTIKGGEKLIRGFTKRDANTSWLTIFQEWDSGNGPEKSMFADFTGTSKTGPFNSLHSTFSSYSSPARATSLTSPDKKGMVTMDYGNANPLVAQDMWEQMWGRSNVSWYKLGDKTMFMMTDSKSMTSFAYRVLPSWGRSSFKLNGNTYQTYIWIENNSTIQNKVTQKNNYIHQEFQKVLNDSQHPTGAKY